MEVFFIPLISLFMLNGLQAKATKQMSGLAELQTETANQMSELAELETKAIDQMSELAELHRNLTNESSSGRIANHPGSGSRVCCR